MKKLIAALVLLCLLGGVGLVLGYHYVKSTLPQLITINDYKPLLVTKVYDRNGKQIGEFFRERRVLVPYKDIPKNVVNAFLAAEDDQFFQHGGINYISIIRAAIANLRAGHTVQGGSTITQQVAKTLLLSSEQTLIRKAKEALLAQEMEEHLSKEDILYLYLNQIYFGQGAYGIEMAAETYFHKTVKELSLAEMAILAGLPKAPSAYSPVHNPVRAKERQVYVLHRMAEVGFIKKEAAEAAIKEPVAVYLRETYADEAPFFLETVRQLLVNQLGEEMVLDRGLRVYTSLDLQKQKAAQESMISGLKDLDKRQGFRGALKNTTNPKEVGEFLLKTRNHLITEATPARIIQPDGHFVDYGPLDMNFDIKKGLPNYLKVGQTTEGIVSKVDDDLGLVYVRVAELQGIIDFESMQWARKPNPEKAFYTDQIKKPSQALKVGDIIQIKVMGERFGSARLQKILVQQKKSKKVALTLPDFSKYIAVELDQDPITEASVLSFDLQTQDILAMIGGTDYDKSQFNRAIQAARQTGSSFKSIVYASAFDKGYTASTPIMDAPIVYEEQQEDAEGQEDTKVWKPTNHSKKFGGDIIFRNALVRSLNVPTVKIIEDIKVDWAATYAKRLGVFSPLNMDFTLALGSSSLTLYEMTKVFSEFGRMGKRIRPVIIHRVEDSNGQKLLDQVSLDSRFTKELGALDQQFEEKRKAYLDGLAEQQAKPENERTPIDPKKNIDANLFFQDEDQLIKPTTAYLITSLLKGVVEDPHGTGARAKALGREVAGKTGTTNGYYDAWFVGYTPQIATGVWVGFDQARTLGKGEVGGRSALPIWLEYMKSAHEDLPQMTFPVPDGIVFANIDSETGELASSGSKSVIRQAYLEGTEPTTTRNKQEENTDFYKQDLSD